ncbi:MAG: c-type cytochrome [Paraglaciecola sp.]|uniref:cytochrome c n=1 Tax=Paraglaciecola sp. TaxID=1920173 RepID=UPI00273F3081|nr:cytochrome c [Paraglaciecola sp.]MDP5030369.1 c-type cytochrome [Paraglaciecola sp.]MDP5132250.1 c-type cytochrome [Paraglaciecola sp.]
MHKGIIISLALITGVGLFGIYAWHSPIEPINPQQNSAFTPQEIALGKTLASAGYCGTCHTAPDGQQYAGNYQMHTEFGTIYTSNITPDEKTGIGSWSLKAFERAMRSGVSRDGHHLLPAFPYEHFNKMSAEDIKAIYAYIMTSIPAVNQVKEENGIPFPLNIRWLQAGWKLLFADTSEFAKQSDKSEDWNRGAYLSEGLAHCGACHTPRNAVGAEDYDNMYAGAAIDGWYAPSLTASNPAPLPWRAEDFYEYLSTGNSTYHDSAGGPMAPVVHAGLSALSSDDLMAISLYFADKAGSGEQNIENNEALLSAINAQQALPDLRLDKGANLYAAACQSCHYSGQDMVKGRPLLALGSSLHLDEPTNLINVILDGFRADQGIHGVVMPAFRQAFTDEDIATIAAYLRQSAGEKAWPNLISKVGEVRRQPQFAH